MFSLVSKSLDQQFSSKMSKTTSNGTLKQTEQNPPKDGAPVFKQPQGMTSFLLARSRGGEDERPWERGFLTKF